MRLLTMIALLSIAVAASAQTPSGGATDVASHGDTPRRARAPLASPGDLEPAVDVGGQRVAVLDGPSAAAALPSVPAAPPARAPATSAATAPSQPSRAASPSPQASAKGASSAQRAGAPRALDSLDLGTTSITGNQELPKVLYIVPWKKSDLGDLVGRPVNTLLDEVLAPVDPEVFERHLEYYETLYGKGREE